MKQLNKTNLFILLCALDNRQYVVDSSLHTIYAGNSVKSGEEGFTENQILTCSKLRGNRNLWEV